MQLKRSILIGRKRGVSEIVSYVLLISITFAIAAIVYSWLMFYVTPSKELRCDDGVALTIRSITYNCTNKSLSITLQNRGLFNVDGYMVRVNNRTGADVGVYTINLTGIPINTDMTIVDRYVNSTIKDGSTGLINGNLTFVEVQAFNFIESQTIFCDNIAKHVITCS